MEEITRRERHQAAAEAKRLSEQKNYQEAATLLEKATGPGAAEGDLARWLPLLGRCYEQLGSYSKALTAYQEAYRLRGKIVDRMLDLARLYERVELNDSAIDLYQQVLKKEKRRDVFLVLAQLNHKTGRLGDARKYVERYLLAEPQDLSALKLQARILEDQGDLAAAAHQWEGVLSREPAAEDYFRLGRLWSVQNQYELAEIAFRKAESLGITSPALNIQKGLLAWQGGDVKSAGESWERARAQNAELPLTLFLLALRDAQSGRPAEAKESMQRAEQDATPYMKSLAEIFLKDEKESPKKQ